MRRNSKPKNAGFTFIELLVVIFIIGVLSSVVMTNLSVARKKARSAKRQADFQEIGKALFLYYNDKGHYPFGCGPSGCVAAEGDGAVWQYLEGELVPTYISKLSQDPKFDGTYPLCSPAGGVYHYESLDGVSWKLSVCDELEYTLDKARNSCGSGYNGLYPGAWILNCGS